MSPPVITSCSTTAVNEEMSGDDSTKVSYMYIIIPSRAVRFQNFHLGSGSGTFIKRTLKHFKAFAQQIVIIKLQNEQLITS